MRPHPPAPWRILAVVMNVQPELAKSTEGEHREIDVEAAIKECQSVLDAHPNDVTTLNRIGDLWLRLNRTDEAVKVYGKIAEGYARDGFFLKAIAIFKKINKLDPSKLDVYEKLADLYAKQGLALEAKSQYQVLADYYIKHGDHSNGVMIYRKIAELDPTGINVHVKLADLYLQANQTEDALKEYELVGKMLLKRGMFDEGIQVLKRAAKIESNAPLMRPPSDATAGPETPDAATRESTNRRISELEFEVNRLNREMEDRAQALFTASVGGKQHESQIQELEKTVQALNEKQHLAHILSRVGDQAQRKLLESSEFRTEFSRDVPREAFVLSIDIRRSTELMLKAREPKLFAKFMITLAGQLRQVLLDNFGIFDKFTGDGVLAFFPTFYSGEDSGYLALKAAARCHEIFDTCYTENRGCFVSVLKDTGLAVGLDYGSVQVVQLGGDFTVVGTPVVYACRMAGGTAGLTWVNQPAYEKLFHGFSEFCDFEESSIELKAEGQTLAYRARLNGKAYSVRWPPWLAPTREPSA